MKVAYKKFGSMENRVERALQAKQHRLEWYSRTKRNISGRKKSSLPMQLPGPSEPLPPAVSYSTPVSTPPLPTNMVRNPFYTSDVSSDGSIEGFLEKVSSEDQGTSSSNILPVVYEGNILDGNSLSVDSSFLSDILSQEPTIKDLGDGHLNISGLLTPEAVPEPPTPVAVNLREIMEMHDIPTFIMEQVP